MADIALFLQQGWTNIWKRKSILFFAAVTAFGSLPFVLLSTQGTPLSRSAPLLYLVLFLGILLVLAYCVIVGAAGRVFTAYAAAIGEEAPMAAAWAAVKRSWRKVFQLYCLLAACLLPFLCVIVILASRKPVPTARSAHLSSILIFALAAISAVWEFWFAGIVVRGTGIRESFRTAWATFSRHFGPLACTGLILHVAWYLLNLGTSLLSLFLKSGFDASILRTID